MSPLGNPCHTTPHTPPPAAGDSDPEQVDFIEGSLTGEEEEEETLLEVTTSSLTFPPPQF